MFFSRIHTTRPKQVVAGGAGGAVSYYANLVGSQYVPVVKGATYTEQGITTNVPGYSLSTVIKNRTATTVGSVNANIAEYYTLTYTVTGSGNTITLTRYVYITDAAAPTFSVTGSSAVTATGAVSISIGSISEQYVTFQAYTDSGRTTLVGSVSTTTGNTATLSFTDSTGKASSKIYYLKATDSGGYNISNVKTANNVNSSISRTIAPSGTNIPANTALFFLGSNPGGTYNIHQIVCSYTFVNQFNGEYDNPISTATQQICPVAGNTNSTSHGAQALSDLWSAYGSHDVDWSSVAVQFVCSTGSSVLADGTTFTMYYGTNGTSRYPTSFSVYNATINAANPTASTQGAFQYGTLTFTSSTPVTGTSPGGTSFTRNRVIYTYNTT